MGGADNRGTLTSRAAKPSYADRLKVKPTAIGCETFSLYAPGGFARSLIRTKRLCCRTASNSGDVI